jgi:hypothetical protein
MDPKTIIALADGALGLVETLAPHIAAMVRSGQITVEQQKTLDDRIAALRPGGSAFAGPEWQA